MDINVQISKKVFNDIYLPYLDNKARYLIFYGGGGSGKSYFIAQRYTYKLMQNSLCNVLVTRSVGNTNRDSTFALLKQVINKWNISKYFKINESDLRIKCIATGNEIIFKGLDDTEKLKSITFSKGELTDIWMEEASETNENDLKQLDIRLRGKGSEKQIILSFNPIDINHWIKKRFFDKSQDNVNILKTTYNDNKFLNEADKQLLESFKETDPYYYDVYCLGMWGVLGNTIFDAHKINQRLNEIKPPIKVGFFIYNYDGQNIKDIRWCDDPKGYIKIYKDVKLLYPYVIGGDTSGDGSDYFIGQVLDNTTGEQVATLRHQFDEDVYAQQMYCLGKHYNDALIGIEANFSTFPIKEMQRLGYYRQYAREQMDTYTGKKEKRYGFKTTSVSRPVIISGLITIARESPELINDKQTLEEMLTFVRSEKGKPEAQKGAHDDCVMGLAIAHKTREQQRYTPNKIVIHDEDYTPYDDQVEALLSYGKY
jgi:phage terminase large subunit